MLFCDAHYIKAQHQYYIACIKFNSLLPRGLLFRNTSCTNIAYLFKEKKILTEPSEYILTYYLRTTVKWFPCSSPNFSGWFL